MESGALVIAPVGVLALLLVCVALSDALARWAPLKRVGAAMLVIVMGALLANLRIIPPAASGGNVYDAIFDYVVPAAIFLILLDVNLGALRRAGAPILIAFFIGAAGTFAGVLVANALTPAHGMLGDNSRVIAGMFTGTYIGGGANLTAIAQAYGVTRDGALFTSTTVVDNVMTDLWIIATLAMPALLARTGWFGKSTRPADEMATHRSRAAALPGTLAFGVPLALTVVVIWASQIIAQIFAAAGWTAPSILIVTTLALLLAQIPRIARLTNANTIGLWAIYLFLAVVGAQADIGALIAAGQLTPMLFAYVAIVFVVHAIILIGAGALLKLEPIMIALASSANIGGSSTAFVLAEAEKRQDLVLPAILIGSIGNALGTYAGFAMVALT